MIRDAPLHLINVISEKATGIGAWRDEDLAEYLAPSIMWWTDIRGC
jgi:hypothetical protein